MDQKLKSFDRQMPTFSSVNSLRRFKKILTTEEQKSINRINLIKKTSQKMINDHLANLNNLLKSKPAKQPIESQVTKTRSRKLSQKNVIKSQEEICSVKSVLSHRERGNTLMAESRRKQKQMNENQIAKLKERNQRRNLKSAQLIRNAHEQTKCSKQKFFQWKIESVRNQNRQKFLFEQQAYEKKVRQINKLKQSEKDALLFWNQIKNQLVVPSNSDV